MRVLILGAEGMLGHKMWQCFRDLFECKATIRLKKTKISRIPLLQDDRIIDQVDVRYFDRVEKIIEDISPDAIINCIGIVKQRKEATDPLLSIEINALLPHRLAQLCAGNGIRFVHISTDCVFSGRRGDYVETDLTDAEDMYGRTKALGEVETEGSLTIRTSIVGRQLFGTTGLLEWFLSQRGKRILGFKKVVYTGLTTLELVRVIESVLSRHQELSGIVNVASEPITKYDLLCLFREILSVDVKIVREEDTVCNRSLNSRLFMEKTGYSVPSWREMIEEIRKDPTPYDKWRKANGFPG